VEAGGLFVTVGNNAAIPIDFGIADGVSIQNSTTLMARGSIFNANFADRKSPISYGYDEKLAVYFNQSPLFQVGGGGGFGGGGGGGPQPGASPASRPTGRGSTDDPDVVQGRDQYTPPPAASPTPNPNATPLAMQPRVVLRFAPEKELLVSGMLAGGSELAGRPAVVDVPVGRGHVVMFANNPMWRHQTNGSFSLLFNAILNFDNLGVGRTAARPAGPARPTAETNEEN
ncbi:MAG TPA: hypothetical protein VNA17_01385, partial [Pyrinomonadaceae bacterium]|nr:hypothetical protein [Pyrinomonadaceae bacterium]